MTIKKNIELSFLSSKLDNLIWGHYLNFRNYKIPLVELSFSKKATKLIVKNADFFSCSNYIIENNLVTLTGATEKLDEHLCSHILAELVKIISPSKSSAVNGFETFYDRYISHSSYTEIELAQLHSMAERICNIGKTYFHPNEDSLAFLLHIKYFVLRILMIMRNILGRIY